LISSLKKFKKVHDTTGDHALSPVSASAQDNCEQAVRGAHQLHGRAFRERRGLRGVCGPVDGHKLGPGLAGHSAHSQPHM